MRSVSICPECALVGDSKRASAGIDAGGALTIILLGRNLGAASKPKAAPYMNWHDYHHLMMDMPQNLWSQHGRSCSIRIEIRARASAPYS